MAVKRCCCLLFCGKLEQGAVEVEYVLCTVVWPKPSSQLTFRGPNLYIALVVCDPSFLSL